MISRYGRSRAVRTSSCSICPCTSPMIRRMLIVKISDLGPHFVSRCHKNTGPEADSESEGVFQFCPRASMKYSLSARIDVFRGLSTRSTLHDCAKHSSQYLVAFTLGLETEAKMRQVKSMPQQAAHPRPFEGPD